jgi:hypothetical protein
MFFEIHVCTGIIKAVNNRNFSQETLDTEIRGGLTASYLAVFCRFSRNLQLDNRRRRVRITMRDHEIGCSMQVLNVRFYSF